MALYDPDLERGRAAAEEVRRNGGSAMEAALKWIEVSFDQTARDRMMAERREQIERRRKVA